MKNSISQIVIMNYYKREKEGKYLKKLVEISARKYGIPVQIAFDDGSLGVWGNYAQALTMGGGREGSHRIVIHDDMSFDRNVLEKIMYILEKAPSNKILMMYNPTNTDYIECNQNNRHVLETYQNFWAQCGIYPNAFIDDFVNEMNVMAREDRADDDRLAAYLKKHDMSLFSIVPSLIQHFGAFRSTFNFPGKVGQFVRNSSTYDSQFDVKKVDWKYEFNNPVKSKLNKDYTKLVYKEEYLDA